MSSAPSSAVDAIMSASAAFGASSFFEQAASVNMALKATSNKRFADAEIMASPFSCMRRHEQPVTLRLF
jgi:hypothetical protein